ncbi:hypothetical protein T11_10222 [Trichinella zimbabwensis]|uniref:Uncharacterized protein n=2 Tax=Trichinella TaxID=6333 RepID=A0A0V1M7S3_9BILA|nr:hypothetical protein T11_10222 [Trichinella zimbabwensis]KRZ67715.1 hypothetical protein T10_9654 [Trichinella papuae]
MEYTKERTFEELQFSLDITCQHLNQFSLKSRNRSVCEDMVEPHDVVLQIITGHCLKSAKKQNN